MVRVRSLTGSNIQNLTGGLHPCVSLVRRTLTALCFRMLAVVAIPQGVFNTLKLIFQDESSLITQPISISLRHHPIHILTNPQDAAQKVTDAPSRKPCTYSTWTSKRGFTHTTPDCYLVCQCDFTRQWHWRQACTFAWKLALLPQHYLFLHVVGSS